MVPWSRTKCWEGSERESSSLSPDLNWELPRQIRSIMLPLQSLKTNLSKRVGGPRRSLFMYTISASCRASPMQWQRPMEQFDLGVQSTCRSVVFITLQCLSLLWLRGKIIFQQRFWIIGGRLFVSVPSRSAYAGCMARFWNG